MFEKAIKIILAEPPELHYPSYYADLLREKSSEIPNSSDLNKFIDGLEEIFADIRERHGDDSVCGLCEYDGAYIGQSGDWCNECPGFDRDDCFKLSDECRKQWIDTITNSLPSAQPETHACDLIDRQAAIDALREGAMVNYQAAGNDNGLIKAINVIKGLPSAEPKRKKGTWIDHFEDGFVECPFCHSATNCDGNRDELHYCFSCGAELR